MYIIWHGQTCFNIVLGYKKEEQTSIIIDPYTEKGFSSPRLKADIVMVTNGYEEKEKIISQKIKPAKRSPFLIKEAGEYEVGEAFIRGIASNDNKKNIIYSIRGEEIKMCHLGKISQKELTSSQLDELGPIDVLMVPVGDKDAIDSKTAFNIISQIEPKIIIPMYYKAPNLRANLDGLEKFLKVMGERISEKQKKLSLKEQDLTPEREKSVVILEPVIK